MKPKLNYLNVHLHLSVLLSLTIPGFYGMGTDPIAYAPGFYGAGTSPNKSPRRKPGDRDPKWTDPVAYAQGFYGMGDGGG